MQRHRYVRTTWSFATLAVALVLGSCASSPDREPPPPEPIAADAGQVAAEAGRGAAEAVAADVAAWSELERLMVELSFASYAGFWLDDPELAAAEVSAFLAGFLPGQELVWGPAAHSPDTLVFTHPTDALVFMCRDAASGDYTVVFRGTNPISGYEWLFQDFMIDGQTPWNAVTAFVGELRTGSGGAPDEALVSDGTATALSLRLALTPGQGFPGAGTSLADALVGLAGSADGTSRIRFTGHSLGGLLAPVAALWLSERLDDALEGAARPSLSVHGIASPTPGNAAFAAYLDSRLPDYDRYANSLDVAALAWAEESMAILPGLYKPTIRMTSILKQLYRFCSRLARGKGYAHAGELVPVPSSVVPVYGDVYSLQMIYQHSVAYLHMLEPERREAIVAGVIGPLAELVRIPGAEPFDVRKLFAD